MTQPDDHTTAALAVEVPDSVLGEIAASTDPVDPDECAANPTFRAVAGAAYAAGARASAIRPIVEAHIGAHLAAQAEAVTRYGVQDAAGVVHDAFGPDDALAIADDPDHRHGPQPRRAVWWVETRGPLLTIQPAATTESRAAA